MQLNNRPKIDIKKDIKTYSITLIIAILAGVGYSREVHLANAWNGWAPPGYVWSSDKSSKIVDRDFSRYQNLHIGNSVLMRVYPKAYNLLGIDPTKLQIVVIYISCILYGWALVFLVKTLLPESASLVPILTATFALLSSVIEGDLSRFGQANVSLGQYYAFAVSLQIIAVGFAIRAKPLACGLFIAILVWVHPIIAGITAWAAGSTFIQLRQQPSLLIKKLLGLGLVCVSCFFYFSILKENIVPTESMPVYEWLNWVRFGNFHWFPFELGVFTRENTKRVLPLLAVFLLACCYFHKNSEDQIRVHKWQILVASCILLTALGLLHSLLPFSIHLTMASLHRASGLLLILALPFACNTLYAFIKQGGVKGGLALVATATPLSGGNGFPILPSLILFLFGVRQYFNSIGKNKFCKIGAASLLGVVVINILWVTFFQKISCLDANIIGSSTSWLALFVVLLVTKIGSLLQRNKYKTSFFKIAAISILICLTLMSAYNNWKSHPRVPSKKLADDFYEVQKWAHQNTPVGSVFALDPAHGYGWKDYSARPSWGNRAVWLHTCIVYHSDKILLKEGLRRANALGVNPEQYMEQAKIKGELTVAGKTANELQNALHVAYYNLSTDQVKILAKNENIDYFVFRNQDATKYSGVPAYENNSFKVFKVK